MIIDLTNSPAFEGKEETSSPEPDLSELLTCEALMMDSLHSVAVWYNGVQQLSYHSLDTPMQTNVEFQALITAANAGGILFISHKGKEVSSQNQVLVPSASSESHGAEIGEGANQSALMVSI